MSRSIARLPEPSTPPPTGERRRRIRQKLHTPVYASFNGPQTGMVVDLSELLDLSEEGFAVQTAIAASENAVTDSTALGSEVSDETAGEVADQKTDGLQVNQHVSLCLDLPETKSFVHGSGQVIWCDDTGRAGIRFGPLAPDAGHALKKWLFSNLLIGCANHSARKDQLARQGGETSVARTAAPAFAPEPSPTAAAPEPVVDRVTATVSKPSPAAAIAQRAEMLSALDEVRNQIRKLTAGQVAPADKQTVGEAATDRINAILQLITQSAVVLTGATGAALALEDNGEMVCQARDGDPAPVLGSHVDVSRGVSGECVRTVRPILCHDTASDRRVDPELCRALGLGSFLAVPIVADFHVAGLFEVFSPNARAFSSDEITILQRLAELVPVGQSDKSVVETPIAASPATPGGDQEVAAMARELPVVHSDGKAAVVGERVAESHPDASNSPATTDASATEINPLDHLRAALWDHASELEQQARQAVEMRPVEAGSVKTDLDEIDAEDSKPEAESVVGSGSHTQAVRELDYDQVEEDESADADESGSESDSDLRASSPIHHLGLLLVCLAVVALALGYLLAPVIERHLNKTADGTQSSSGTVQAASPSKAQLLAPEEIRKLAEQGDSEAQFMLGTLYRNGDGLLQNDSKAIEWFQRAADQGHPLALRALGSAYWAGRGVEQNYSRAYFWYELALAMGDQESKSRLEGLATQMTQRQVSDARQQAEAWLQAHNQPPKTASN